MSLNKYAEKRNFARTPEPKADSAAPTTNFLQFCVQRHHASHLHYDLRLQVGGALRSWAVPKGPTLDPTEKRLAMMVEDHPLAYSDFEGVIPDGYGKGSVMLWDRGTYELIGDATVEEQLTRGDFKFHLFGKKINGDFAIVRIKDRIKKEKSNQWLLIKKKDAHAVPGWDPEDHAFSVLTGRTQEEIAQGIQHKKPGKHQRKFPAGATVSEVPKIITPMLATLGKGSPPDSEDWLYEVKWDGVRAITTIDGGRISMASRNGNLMEKQYPELSLLPSHVDAQQAVLDGEIAALDPQGRPRFELLQQRINVADASAAARLARAHPVTFFAFDLLYLDGHDLRAVPLTKRKELLKEILQIDDRIRYSEHFAGHGTAMLEAVKQQGLEGIVGKRADSPYQSRRVPDWVKWKVQEFGDFFICGFTEGERAAKGAATFGALVLGVADEDKPGKLRWAGNVGTGFDEKTIRRLHEKLTPFIATHSPLLPDRALPKKISWVKPELSCQVKFANLTEDGRLRAPVYLGLKEPGRSETHPSKQQPELLDKTAEEATLEIDHHRLKFTNLSKLYFPKDGYVKRDLLNYYNAVAPLILPHLKDRPLSLKRYPNGIEKPYFFQKQAAESFPPWLHTAKFDDKDWVVGHDRATLLYLVNLGCIDHNPWMSRLHTMANPDYVLIDLDPYECGYEKIVEAALWVRGLLDRIHLTGYPKTTGGDGMHIMVPLEPVYTYAQVRQFAEALAALGASERPDLFTTPRTVSKREKGKVYFDWQQIAEGKTISAPYVLRAHAGAPVATPLEWKEVTPRLRPEQFHLGNALARFDRVGDLFAGVLEKPQSLEQAVENFARRT